MSIKFNNDFINKNIYTKKLTIDSFDRNKNFIPKNYKTSNPSYYQINLDKYTELQNNIIGINLVSAFIPCTEYIINENNNKFDIISDSVTYTIELKKGNYNSDGEQFASYIETQIHHKITEHFTVHFQEDLNIIEFTNTNNSPFALLLETGPNCDSHFNELIGLEKKDIESNSEYMISTNNISMHSSKYIDIVIDEIPNIGLINNTKDHQSYILDRIFFDLNYGNYKLHYNRDYDRIYNFFNPIGLKNFTIKLYNDKNLIYNSQNLDNVITLEFIILKNNLPNKIYLNEQNNYNKIFKYIEQLIDSNKINKKLMNTLNENNESCNEKLINTLNENNESCNEKLIKKLTGELNNTNKRIIKELYNENNIKELDNNENNIKKLDNNEKIIKELKHNSNNIILIVISLLLLIKILYSKYSK
tara:strand:- start:548 stop:1801 length:1254 start_codon:yes stop_codon:yes gene_type:complete